VSICGAIKGRRRAKAKGLRRSRRPDRPELDRKTGWMEIGPMHKPALLERLPGENRG
jgi:hypothetical protein